MGASNNKNIGPTNFSQLSFSLKPFKLINDAVKHPLCKCQAMRRETPKPRSGHRIVCNDTNVFSFGGYNPTLNPSDEEDLASDSIWSESKPLFKELWKYNISTKIWSKLIVEDMPDILASNAVLLSGQLLIVYGGTGVPFGANCSNDLYICDLRNDNLKFNLVYASGQYPPPQYGQAIALINNYLYTIGGTTGFEYTCDIHRLNVRDGVWEEVYTCTGANSEPSGRYRHEIVFFKNKLYVLGGGTAREAFDFESIYAFDVSINKWEKIVTRPDTLAIESYPTPRRCHSSVQHDRYAYIIGGFSGRSILKDIWRIDLITMVWKKLRGFSLNKGAYFHSSCITPSGKLINFGGIVPTETTSTRSAQVHSAWLCIPKLKDICWEAVLYYLPLTVLLSLSEEQLTLLGIPSDFIRRLDLQK